MHYERNRRTDSKKISALISAREFKAASNEWYRCLQEITALRKLLWVIKGRFRTTITRMTYEAEYERLVARTYDDAYAIIRDPSGASEEMLDVLNDRRTT